MTKNEVENRLSISEYKRIALSKLLGLPIRQGETYVYTDDDVKCMAEVIQLQQDLDKSPKFFERYSRARGDTRMEGTIWNESLGKKVKGVKRYTYNWLVATGDWDKGVTSIPKGYVLHHKDGNTTHDDVDNLLLLSIKEHRALHDSLGTRTHDCRDRMTGRKSRKTPVRCVETGRTYASITEAAVDCMGTVHGIHMALSGKQDTAYGCHWERA